MYEGYSYSELKETFHSMTKHFDLEDWRVVRTPLYWEADKMKPILALEHKLELIEFYINKGYPLNLEL